MHSSVRLFKRKAAVIAAYGAIITLALIILATLISAWSGHGRISMQTIIDAQLSNAALWVLDVMPVLFILWGRYFAALLVNEADSIMARQTHEMWDETRQLHEQIRQENTHDALTQLPNSEQFQQELEQLIQLHHFSRDPHTLIETLSGYIANDHPTAFHMAVVLIDIDNFKEINNSLGAHNGDSLLKMISLRLRKEFQDSPVTIARVGGDDFGLLLPDTSDAQCMSAVQRVRQIFKMPFDLNGVSIILEVSIGVTVYPQHGDTAKELLQHTEIAMYACKREARDYAFYNPGMNIHDLKDLILKTEVRQSFENDELLLHYQPKINRNNQVQEVEALVRWYNPKQGMVSPDTFIPIIIRQRLNSRLLQRVLDLALTQAQVWREEGIRLRIALNLTAFDLQEPKLPEMIMAKLKQYGLSTEVLKLELTETTLVENQDFTLKTLTRLSSMGIPVSIDDFGTGYSSMAYLSSLPVQEVKIDRSFVTDMHENPRNRKIVQAIIALAHGLSLQTVAEGVENEETLERLKSMNCDAMQGFFISKPLNGQEFSLWLSEWQQANKPPLSSSKQQGA